MYLLAKVTDRKKRLSINIEQILKLISTKDTCTIKGVLGDVFAGPV